jgi:hypothetical protein
VSPEPSFGDLAAGTAVNGECREPSPAVAVHDIKWIRASCREAETMTKPDKSKIDAAEKLMLDLMEKHPGASECSLLALFQNVAREKDQRCCEHSLVNL